MYKTSFIPIVSEWNTLPLDVRQSDIRIFKEKLIVKSNFVYDKPRHDFYVLGDMYTMYTMYCILYKEKLIVKSNFVCDKPRHDFYVLGDMYTNIVYYTPNFAIIVHLIVIYY